MLTSRHVEILKAIVDEYIKTAEPVASKTLIEKYGLDYSSATIRNEMADLEELGYLEKTHTSSGRIPSTMGYRYYVEHLLDDTKDERLELVLRDVFADRRLKIDDVIKRSCEILSQMTNLTSVVLGPEASSQRLEHIDLYPIDDHKVVAIFITDTGHTENKLFSFDETVSLDELNRCTAILNDRLVGTPLREIQEKLLLLKPLLAKSITQYEKVFEAFFNAFLKFASEHFYTSGTNNLLNQPEFADIGKLKQLMAMFENSGIWRDLGKTQDTLRLSHGSHATVSWMDDVAVVSSTITLDNEESQLMVVGPSRMEYNRVVALMEFMSQAIETVYGKKE